MVGLDLRLERARPLHVVPEHQAVRQLEEVARVVVHLLAHLAVAPQRPDGRLVFALAAVPPPGSERGQADLECVFIGGHPQPLRENGPHKRVEEAGSWELLIGPFAA